MPYTNKPGLDPAEFYRHIIFPTLDEMEMGGDAACQLLLGTALVEGNLEHIVQTGSGPALGPYQMEPATHDDIWAHYLAFSKHVANDVHGFMFHKHPRASEMKGNFYYATAMARVHYWRVRAPLPQAGDLEAMAWYWKRWFHTFHPGETKKHQLKEIARFVGRFPEDLL